MGMNKHILVESADCSVRVSNELGAAHPLVAKFSMLVVNANSIIISLFFSAIVLIFKVGLSEMFTSDAEVILCFTRKHPAKIRLNGRRCERRPLVYFNSRRSQRRSLKIL